MKFIRSDHRRGLSIIVSSLLMIFVAVACSVLTYSWVINMIGFQSARAQTDIRVEQVIWINQSNIVVTVRDVGAVSVTLESISVKKSQSNSSPDVMPLNTSISPGSVNELHIHLSTTALEDNTSYLIRVTTTTGFYYEYTSSTGIIH